MSKHRENTENESPSIENITQLYSALTDEEKKIVQENYYVRHFKKNDIIYMEGDVPKELLCLGSGKVKIYINGLGGHDQIIRMATPPGFIGYRALLVGDSHYASAIAIEPCSVFYLPKEIVHKLLETNNKLNQNIIESLAKELGFSRLRIISLTQKHIRGRLAESLLILLDIYGLKDDNVTLNVSLSREDLANLSNMTTSNAIRTLSVFANEGIITVEGRVIKILDQVELQHISKLG